MRPNTYPRLKPVDESHNMRMVEVLEQVKLVLHHLLIPLHVLLEDNLDGHLAGGALGLPDDAICAGTESTSKSIFRSIKKGNRTC